MCGEKSGEEFEKFNRSGSPPRVRGKEGAVLVDKHHAWITPACAGKSKYDQAAQTTARDHPRVCGEKYPDTPCPFHSRGSPPRVRGKEGRIIV